MFTKCFCQQCNGHIEFDAGYAGMPIACPHCGSQTILSIATEPLPPSKIRPETTPTETETGCDVLPGPWMKEPMTEKQKGMFTLYGIPLEEAITKGDASKLIDEAKRSGIQPTEKSQAQAEKIFRAAELDSTKEKLKAMCADFLEIVRRMHQKKTTSKELEGFKLRFQQISEDFNEILEARFYQVDEEECDRKNREDERLELGG